MGASIEAMHDAGPVLTLHLGKIADSAMSDERVHERVTVMPACGMTDEAGLLGKHDEVLVLVADVERYVIGSFETGVLSAARGNLYMDHITGDDDALLGRGLAVDEYTSRLDEPHGRRARGELVDA